MKGIDISHWQAGLDLAQVKPDFVILKATESINYTDTSCDSFYQTAKRLGIPRGVYHFARNSRNTAKAEADFFVSQVKGYIGDALLVLDWEDPNGNKKDVAWAKTWLDRVYALTGVRPLIYMSSSVVNSTDWSSVACDYGLWVANYGVNNGQQNTKPSVKYWSAIAIWQYTSVGKLPGYSGNLDLDEFYGDETTWNKYAGKTTAGDNTSSINKQQEGESMDLSYYGVKTEAELKQNMAAHLGENDGRCAWGDASGNGGGYLGAERRKTAVLEKQLEALKSATPTEVVKEVEKVVSDPADKAEISRLETVNTSQAQTIQELQTQLNYLQNRSWWDLLIVKLKEILG